MEEKPAYAGPEAIAPMDKASEKSLPHSASDMEKQAAPESQQLQRKLNSRHLQFVAIGMSQP
jgi:amino acid transporter